MENILLIGAGGHARACIDVIEQQGRFTIYGLIADKDQVGNSILGYPVLGTDDELPEYIEKSPNAVVAVGQIDSAQARIRLFDLLLEHGFNLPPVISALAYVSSHATISRGTVVMHGSIINAGAMVGENCIINSRALVEHDAMIDHNCHISTGAIINGGSKIGSGSFIGSGSVIRENIRIGERCFIGMNQRVVQDCAAQSRVS